MGPLPVEVITEAAGSDESDDDGAVLALRPTRKGDAHCDTEANEDGRAMLAPFEAEEVFYVLIKCTWLPPCWLLAVVSNATEGLPASTPTCDAIVPLFRGGTEGPHNAKRKTPKSVLEKRVATNPQTPPRTLRARIPVYKW